MAREVFRVPGTGTGVERQFSRSGKVKTKLRAHLDPVTTVETMIYVDMLKRKKRAIAQTEVVRDSGEGEREATEDEPPAKWRNDWFKSRKNKRTVL